MAGSSKAFWGRPNADIQKLNAGTLSGTDAVYCACHHTDGAHKPATPRPCVFCRCEEFRPQLAVTETPSESPLTPAGQRALQILSQTPVFQSIPKKGLDVLAQHARKRLYLAGSEVMVQGDKSHSLHVIVKGKATVERYVSGSVPVKLAELGPGEVVGEMGVLDGKPRSATVIAASDLETLEFTADTIKQLFREFPQALLAVLKVVSQRVRDTDALVEQALEVALNQFEEGA